MTEETREDVSEAEVLRMTAAVVSAYVRNNSLPTADVTGLIGSVHRALAELNASAIEPEAPTPVVPINKSIQPDHLICLEDGRKLKMLKRHLRTTYGMTPEDYRAKWGLPADYPMVAPSYAKQRSAFAKQIGLGTKGGRRKKRR
ncbi:MucR family transcriptional regulator [Algihabitans albus]|uniref:MucR family transcriptional regulator n=1 Tax=Algihabitans albus TaxID=2164067 RepID=UPI000E5D1C84|nr:MucR family transcriptional regulator [Algihabitans albus]